MSELLFECYGVPGIVYGVDSLFAHHFNNNLQPLSDALIINLGYHTCHIVPIVNNVTVFDKVRRLNIGGFHIITFLHRILQLKYPAHATSITLSRAEELLHTICEIAIDYIEQLNKWLDVDYYEENIKKIQLPYNFVATTTALTAEQQKERKRELARRLTEINARKREERLAEDEEKLNLLLQIQEMIDLGVDKSQYQRSLNEYQLKNVNELQKAIANLNTKIERTKQKILAANQATDENSDEPVSKQAKFQKINFENEKDLHSFLQNIKTMVKI